MGRNSKLRRQRRDDPQGPRRKVGDYVDADGQLILHAQQAATGYGEPVCVGPIDGDWSSIAVTRQNPQRVPEAMQRWVPPLDCDPLHLHPVFVDLSAVSGKWRVVLMGMDRLRILDVFIGRAAALRSAQIAQEVFGECHGYIAAASPDRWRELLLQYGAKGRAEGLAGDDEVIAELSDSGLGDGFRVMRATGSVPLERVAGLVDELRVEGVHVRTPGPADAS